MNPTTLSLSAGINRALGHAIDAVGSADFDHAFLELLATVCGAEYCALYQIRSAEMQSVGAASRDGSDLGHRRVGRYLSERHWERDPTIVEARRRGRDRGAHLIRIQPREFRDSLLRRRIYSRIGERLLVSGRRGESLFGLSILRGQTSGSFADRDAAAVYEIGDVLVSTVAKHAAFAFPETPAAGGRLETVPAIERRLAWLFPGLPHRERQVGARILFGLSTEGIALDLGLSAETVATYRKRCYLRLGLSGRHDLLRRFLADA